MKDTILVALIGSGATIITVLGTVLVTKLTSNSNLKAQRAAESRKIKQENYNRFLEAFALKTSYINSDVPIEITEKFCIEFNRLPLYASEEVVDLANNMAKNPSEVKMYELYNTIRNDLCDDNYEVFKKLKEFNFQIPSQR